MQTKKTVLFDLDGTLLDTERIYQRFWKESVATLGYHLSEEQLLSFRSLDPRDGAVRMRAMTGSDTAYEEIRTLRQNLMNPYMESHEVPVKKGAVEALTKLRENGFTRAVVTATKADLAARYVERAGLMREIDTIISAHMVAHGKPAPDVYAYACETLGTEPAGTFAVEDAPNGVKSAAAAGCRVIMVPDITEPDEELLPLLTYRADDLSAAADYIIREGAVI